MNPPSAELRYGPASMRFVKVSNKYWESKSREWKVEQESRRAGGAKSHP
jgi:hypothetical protein